MKKILKTFLIISFMFVYAINVKALTPTDNQLENAYIIGHHLFTEDGPRLDIKTIMLAARTIQSDKLEDMIIYYKQAGTNSWVNVANNYQKVNEPEGIKEENYFTHIDLDANEEVETFELKSIKIAQNEKINDNFTNNQKNITIENNKNIISITENRTLKSWNYRGETSEWYAIIIDMGIPATKINAIGEYIIEEADKNASSFGATNENQLILWLKGTQNNSTTIITLQNETTKEAIALTINYKSLDEPIEMRNTISTQSETFTNTYYNKYSQKTLGENDIDDSIYYVNLGKYTGSENPTELTIGNNTYNKDSKYISIGNSAFIMVPVWKIKDNNVLVALPWLATDSLPVGETEIKVGGQTIKIIAYTNIENKKLTLKSVGANDTVDNHTNEITITNENEITYNTGYGTHFGGINIADAEGNIITDSKILIFRKDANGNAGITKPDDGFSYSFYPFAYENKAYDTPESKTLNYKLAFIGKGVIELTIKCNKVVDPIEMRNIISTQSETFTNTYYNKYSQKTLGENDIDDSIYYVNLGKYTGSENPTELTIGNNTYNKDSKYISIGNSAFIMVPVWKIKDNNVLVALPWLATDSLPVGETEIKVGGQTIKIIAYTNIENKKLTLKSVGANNTVDNHTNEITITNENEITYNTGYGTHLGGINIADAEGNIITDSKILIFRKDANGNAGITKPDDGFSYSFYPFAYENKAYDTPENITLNYKLAFIGKGVIELTIKCNKVVD